jgi:hypothetical protein
MRRLQHGGQSRGAMGNDLYRGLVVAWSISSSRGWSIVPPGILVGSIGCSMGPYGQ